MKVLLDTNIWVRYLMQDEEEQFESCRDLIETIEQGKIRPYISSIVLLELYFVLHSVYKIPKKEVEHDINTILDTRGLTILDTVNSKEAFSFMTKHGIKFADCFIATQIKKDMILCTYDEDFKKFDGIRIENPKQILNALDVLEST